MKREILKLLLENQGRYVSGEEISNILNVSRTAIWKHMNSLKEDGYSIDSLQKLGYCLGELPDIISPEEISLRLDSGFYKDIHFYRDTTSTNDMAKTIAGRGAPEGTILLAEKQSSGRGRMGRVWVSNYGDGIWLSLILRPPIMPSHAPQITFVTAVAACQAVREHTGLDVTIKWPNDLMINGKKICGILTELSAEIDLVNHIVVGVGVNVNQDEKGFPEELQKTATSLSLVSGRSYRRIELLVDMLKKYAEIYYQYINNGFFPILQLWKKLNSTLGQEVQVISQEETYYGTAIDIDENGQLLVNTNGTIKSVLAGDVSIRPKIL